MIRSGKYENASDSFNTPQWILDMFPIRYDPCPFNPDWNETDFDGLKDEWSTQAPVIFVNPPYSNVMPWIDKALDHRLYMNMMHPNKTQKIVFLLKHDSSTKWYSKLHGAGAHFMMIQGRLKFYNHKSSKGHASFPSVLVIL